MGGGREGLRRTKTESGDERGFSASVNERWGYVVF
jgi:hypothetical protein